MDGRGKTLTEALKKLTIQDDKFSFTKVPKSESQVLKMEPASNAITLSKVASEKRNGSTLS